MTRKIVFLAICCLTLSSCFDGSKWTAFVYPDINNIPRAGDVQNYTIGEFSTFEECQSAAIARLNYIYETTNKRGDYQCGYKCSIRKDYEDLLICKENRK